VDEASSAATADGGRSNRGFITALGIGQIVSWGTLYYTFPLVAVPMADELGLSKPEVYRLATLALVVAGLAAYPVGVAIDRGHGRRVMTVGAVLAGLMLLAWSRLDSFLALHLVFVGIGFAQAMTLYEPAFAVIVRRFGADARRGITALTLWGGFASTVFVPTIQLLMEQYGWRDALALAGACNLLLCSVLYARAIEPAGARPVSAAGAEPARPLGGFGAIRPLLRRPPFWALLVAFTVFYGAVTALFYHLYPLLVERGLDPHVVVALIAVIGPSQVAARVLIMFLAAGHSIRAIGMATVSVFPLAFLLLALAPGQAALWLFVVLFGAANGIMTIVRGMAVPEMLTREAYGSVNGIMAAPAAAARAFSPMLAAALWAAAGSYQAVTVALLLASVVLAGAFAVAVLTSRRQEPVSGGQPAAPRSPAG
jgi:predicted MFS family arabinose efflux permease